MQPTSPLSLPAWILLLAGVGAVYSLALLVEGTRCVTSALTRALRQRHRRGDRRPTTYPLRTLAYTNPWGQPFDNHTTLGDLRGLDLSAGLPGAPHVPPLSPKQVDLLARASQPLPDHAQREISAILRTLPCTRDRQRHG